MSKQARYFVRQCLVRDPTQRPSAEQLLKHDWLADTGEARVSAGHVIEANINLMNFRKMTVFQQGIVAYIMSFTQRHEEMDRVREVFLELDKSGDGTLSVEELRDGLVRAMGCVKGNLEDFTRIMADLDKDGNGVVDYSEFLAASINKQTIVDQQSLKIAFDMLDGDRNGQITKEELR